MNGHTDQPSELFTQATFQSLEGYAAQHGLGLLSFWSENRDRPCNPDTGAWVVGNCSSIAQQPYDFTRIILQFAGGGPPPSPTPTASRPPSPAPSPSRSPSPRPSPSRPPTPGPTPSATPPPPPPGNLVADPGFEASGLAPWTCSPLAGVVSAPVHSGRAALAEAASSSDDAQCTQVVSVQPGHAYTLSAWVEGAYAFIGVSGSGAGDVSTFTPSASTYTRLGVPFTTGAGTTRVTVFVHGWYAQGTVYVDDVAVS
jgi:chitinase